MEQSNQEGEVVSYLVSLNKKTITKQERVALLMSMRANLRKFTLHAQEEKILEYYAGKLEELALIHSSQITDTNLSKGIYLIYMSEVMFATSLLLEQKEVES